MLKKITITPKLLYLFDILLVIAIAYFLYHGFSKVSAQQTQTQINTNAKQRLIKQQTQSVESPTPETTHSVLQGIDVSHYQGDVLWDSVESQYQFAFIKATEGTYYTDPKYSDNINAIANTSMLYGAYHFFSPDQDALAQARHFITITQPQTHTLPPVLDVEVNPTGSSETLRAAVKIWLTHVEQQTGCRPIIYTNRHYWSEHFDNSFDDYPLWISEYTTFQDKLTDIPWAFWQYTEQGQVIGVSGKVDKSRFRGDVTQLDNLSCSQTIAQTS